MRGGPQPYTHLRQELAKRDRGLREKVVSLEDAASFVRDGDPVGIGGSTMSRTPMALIWALIRAAARTSLCSRCIISSDGDCSSALAPRPHHFELVQPGHPLGRLEGDAPLHRDRQGDLRGMEPHGGRHALPGRRHGRALHADSLDARLRRAGAAARGQEIECPFTGENILLVPALNPDVALIHVQRCDAYGNAQIDGLQFMDIDLAMAANKVILTTERIVLQRPDPASAGPDQDPVLRSGCRGRGAVRLRAARVLRRSTSR